MVPATGEKPLLADGSIVGDYSPLLAYWRKAKEKDRRLAEKALLRREDFEYLDRIVEDSSGKISVAEALSRLKAYFAERIDAELAVEAVREAYRVESIDEGEARRIIAGIMAGWLIEASRLLKKYKVGPTNPPMPAKGAESG